MPELSPEPDLIGGENKKQEKDKFQVYPYNIYSSNFDRETLVYSHKIFYISFSHTYNNIEKVIKEKILSN
jgi:hypothetical protein